MGQAAQRQALLGGDDDRSCTAYGKPSKDRDRFLDANRQLEDASRRLEEATRETLASEQIGAEVMSDLRQQRDTISRSKGNLRTVGHNYGMSKGMLEGMHRRAKANKIMTCAVVVLMVLMV